MTFYLAYGLKRRARLLSDMRGETEFLELINGNEEMTAKRPSRLVSWNTAFPYWLTSPSPRSCEFENKNGTHSRRIGNESLSDFR